MILDLFTRCVLISLLAFGGAAALPLIERIAVAEGWVSPQDFATAVAFGYITPGPVLITMTFLGYQTAGLAGAVAATCGIFLMPWALAAAAAHLLRRWMQHPLLQHFGRGAAPAVVGLLVVTALHLSAAPSQARYMSALPLWPWGWRCGRNCTRLCSSWRGSHRGAIRAVDGGQDAVTSL